MKKTGIGGQAVFEGVMMRGKRMYAVAIRMPDGSIKVEKKDIHPISDKIKLFKLPILRGVVSFIEMLIIGMGVTTYSAEFFEEEGEPSKLEKYLIEKLGDKFDKLVIGFSLILAVILGTGLFMLLPLYLSRLFNGITESVFIQNIIEGIIRIVIFLVYIVLISKMKDIQRIFEYHGSEHKTIHCYEHEEELTPENVMKYPRLHKRCGTAFLLIVMVVAIFVFAIFDFKTRLVKALSRIFLAPLVAGISYEIIKWAGRSESKLANIISKPGLYMQNFTTREPDESQIECAIAALKGVLEDEKDS